MKLLKLILVLAACSYLFGCASGAKMENMVYQGDQKNYPEEIQKNVALGEVSGGKKTNPAWTSEIDNEAFSGAVRNSLESQGLYSDSGKYRLKVEMLKVDQPLFGIDLKVTTHVQYTLTNVESGKVVIDETVITPHTAGFGDAMAAVKRLRLANEGSAQKNIEGLLNLLSELNIDSRQISLAR
jgi:hypothetical protein